MAWWAGSLSPCLQAEHSCPLAKPLSSPQKRSPFIHCSLELAKTQSQMNTGGPLRRPSKNLANHRAGAFPVSALSVATVGCWWHIASLRQASAPNLRGLLCCSAVDLAGRTRPNQLGWSKERKEWCSRKPGIAWLPHSLAA